MSHRETNTLSVSLFLPMQTMLRSNVRGTPRAEHETHYKAERQIPGTRAITIEVEQGRATGAEQLTRLRKGSPTRHPWLPV